MLLEILHNACTSAYNKQREKTHGLPPKSTLFRRARFSDRILAAASAAVVAASAIVVVTTATAIVVTAATAVVGKCVSTSAACEQKNKNDDPAAVITPHKSVPP